ncbi:hypothetical protein [Actinophytocola xanthii]|uniref:Twin-arginine translocation signal domain-containing protein n=1 Tax=Actinophytocola xanthii TaxID=1912961 RepID=A0A1Q8CPF4_9PSEU|nr:hypothetical protein [Actinophytocola xanthii]OLF16218.1 hypothetical protein BU204_17750 [Actinophytocola xanthii]
MTSSGSRLTRRSFVGAVAGLGAAAATGTALHGTASASTAAAAPAKVDRAVGLGLLGGAVHTLGRSAEGWVLVAADGTARATTGLGGAEVNDMTTAPGGLVAVGATSDGARSVPSVWESVDGLAWRRTSELTGLDGHLTVVGSYGSAALAVGASLTLERAPRQRIVVRRDAAGWALVPTTGLAYTDQWTASAVAGGADGWTVSTVDASGSSVATSPDGLDWTPSAQLVDVAVRSLATTGAGIRWVGNAMGGSGAVTGVVGADRRPVPVPQEAQALGTVGDRSYWLVDGRIVSATV